MKPLSIHKRESQLANGANAQTTDLALVNESAAADMGANTSEALSAIEPETRPPRGIKAHFIHNSFKDSPETVSAMAAPAANAADTAAHWSEYQAGDVAAAAQTEGATYEEIIGNVASDANPIN